MREFFRSRRGSVAFATVVALVPVIGFLALGAEGGSWYVIKQHAQSAADAAAYSGALRKACDMGSSACTDAQSVSYRGKQFAAQNSFCDGGDGTAYPGTRCTTPPSGVSRTVTIAELTTWKGTAGTFVQATITQQQPAYLAKLLGFSTVTMAATAVAQVAHVANPCVLSLSDPLTFQGSMTVQAPDCGVSSNSKASNSIDFTGNGLDISNAGAISGQGGCAQTGGSQCSKAITFAPPLSDPLSALNTAMASLTTASFTGGECSRSSGQPIAYDASHLCYNKAGNGSNAFSFGNATYNLSGVYFFSGSLSINSSSTIITGTATLILLPGATLNINGATITLTAPKTVTAAQVPAALASVVNLMSDLIIYDPETTTGNNTVRITGNSSSYFNGIVYAPNADVLYQGSTQSYTCVQVIAKGVSLSGNSNFDNSGCQATSVAESKIVKLVP